MSHPLRAFAAALLAALITAAPASAAPPWSAPVDVATGNPQVAEPTIGFGDSGRPLLSARITTQAFGVPSRGFSRLFGRNQDGTFGRSGRLVLAAPPAVYGQTRTALLRLPLVRGNQTIEDLEDPRSSMGTSFGTVFASARCSRASARTGG
jgi:hypothetical protein